MGNVHASSMDSKPKPPGSLPLPPLQPTPGIGDTFLTPLQKEVLDNPGSIEEIHKKCKELFPMTFEGARLVVNKGLSNHFQISHSLLLGSPQSSGYRFGATYVGMQQISPSEAYPVLLGDMDPNGNLNANVILQPIDKVRFKFQTQSQNAKFQLSQFTLDYKGKNFTTTLMAANPNILNGTGVFVAHYLQSVTKNLAVGAECIYQRMGQTSAGPMAIPSLAFRYTCDDAVYSAQIGMPGVQLYYYQKASDQLQLGVEFDTNLRSMEATGSLGYQIDIPKADLVFKGSVDSNWTVSAVLEKKLLPMPFTMAIGGSLNHRKNDFKLGFGFIIG